MYLDEQFRLKVGLAEMLKGGVIMDVTNAEQALIAEKAWEDLDGPVVRVATPDVPIPFSPTLEQAVLPQVDDVREAVSDLLEY